MTEMQVIEGVVKSISTHQQVVNERWYTLVSVRLTDGIAVTFYAPLGPVNLHPGDLIQVNAINSNVQSVYNLTTQENLGVPKIKPAPIHWGQVIRIGIGGFFLAFIAAFITVENVWLSNRILASYFVIYGIYVIVKIVQQIRNLIR